MNAPRSDTRANSDPAAIRIETKVTDVRTPTDESRRRGAPDPGAARAMGVRLAA